MKNDYPDCFELIRAMDEFLTDIRLKLEGPDRYNLQCAKHVLTILRREIKQTEEDPANPNNYSAEFTKLMTGEKGSIKNFSKNIRDGKYDGNWDTTLMTVLNQVISKVKISNPNHLWGEHELSD